MTEREKGPLRLRRGRGARERILDAARQLFRDQGINSTGVDEISAVASVSKRTVYQHFGSKDELIAENLRRFDPGTMPEVFDREGLTPRERLLAVFDMPAKSAQETPHLCPFIAAAVEISDPEHPARVLAHDYKTSVAVRLTKAAREAGAADPKLLGEQLALLLDGAATRSRALGVDASSTARGIAATLVDSAIPETVPVPPLASWRR